MVDLKQDKTTPDSTSRDYDAMSPYWDKIKTILDGTDAMRDAGKKYLPKFTHEADADYNLRRSNAKFTNIFADIVDSLASKPFEQEMAVENAGELEQYLENIDGLGNHLHTFGANVFHAGVADSVTYVMVDYPDNAPANATVAQVKDLGIRPYWIHIDARDVLAVYSNVINGNEIVTHVRLCENTSVRDGYGEKLIERVRVIDRQPVENEIGEVVGASDPMWELFEKQKDKDGKDSWVSIAVGSYSIGYIPLYAFITGKRKGTSWQIRPPMERAADLQIEHYQQESGLKYMRDRAAFPMLAGNGIAPPMGDDGNVSPIPVGPMAVLFAPPNGSGGHGQWNMLEPAGSSLTFCSNEIDKTEAQLRELGRQPLTAQSGNITTITAAFAGDKAHTVIEAWALNFKDFLENCLKATADWIGQQVEPEVEINTDFSMSLREENGMASLDKAVADGRISDETWFDEAKRRGYLSPNRTYEDEVMRITGEMVGDEEGDPELDAATGMDGV